MTALRSALFNLVMWLSVVVYAPLTLFTFPLPFSWRYRFIIQWARFNLWLLKRLCGIEHRVEGLAHLPTGSAVVLSKHQSAWETLAFQQIFPPFVFVLKRELMWVPLFGWGLALLNPIAINRGSGRKAVEQLVEQGRERLRAGRWVVVFPEGTRMPAGTRGRYRLGGAVLASRTGYPVVPVAHNAGSYWPRRGFIKRRGVIRVVIGPAIDSRGRAPEEILRLAEEWIERQMADLEPRPAPRSKMPPRSSGSSAAGTAG